MSQPAPKTVPVEPNAPKAPPKDPMLDLVAAIPADAKVFILTPADELERATVLEQLQEGVFKYFEEEPLHNHELRVSKLPFGSYLFVAHCVTTRAKRDDGTFGPVAKLHVGGPIDLKKFSARSSDGYTWSVDQGGIIDAIVKVCKHTNGFVWLPMLSGDKEPENRILKLNKS
jgi:hypothetical protein